MICMWATELDVVHALISQGATADRCSPTNELSEGLDSFPIADFFFSCSRSITACLRLLDVDNFAARILGEKTMAMRRVLATMCSTLTLWLGRTAGIPWDVSTLSQSRMFNMRHANRL